MLRYDGTVAVRDRIADMTGQKSEWKIFATITNSIKLNKRNHLYRYIFSAMNAFFGFAFTTNLAESEGHQFLISLSNPDGEQRGRSPALRLRGDLIENTHVDEFVEIESFGQRHSCPYHWYSSPDSSPISILNCIDSWWCPRFSFCTTRYDWRRLSKSLVTTD